MRTTSAFIAVFLTTGLLCCQGCRDSAEPQVKENPFAGRMVSVSFPAGLGFEREWELALAEWKGRTAADVELRPCPTAAGDRNLLHSYGGNVEAAGDLILFPLTGIAELDEAGFFAAISEQRRNSAALNWPDVFKGLRDSVSSRNGVAVPLSCPVLICYYREDLLDAANLTPPQTWAEYQQLVETVDEWAGGLPVVEPWCAEFRATMFLARAVSYVKHPNEYSVFFDIRSGEPLIGRPGFQRALADSLKAVKAMPEDVLTYDTFECRREFFAGRAAMAVTFETGMGNPLPALVPRRDHDPAGFPQEQRPADLRAGFTRLPGSKEAYHHTNNEWTPGKDSGVNRVTLAGFGGLCAAVSAHSGELEAAAAWNLLGYLTADEQFAQTFPPETRSLCRTSQMSYPELWIPQDITAAEGGNYLGEVSRSLENASIVMELPVVKRESFRWALREALGQLLLDQVSAEEALQIAAGRWREISKEAGVKKIRDSYRNSLGLRPLEDDE